MDASCSGRCACNAPYHPVVAARNFAPHPVPRTPIAKLEHRHIQRVKSHKASLRSGAKRKHRQCVTAAQHSGDVAEVQELRGVRIVTDAKKRPQVQYLVNWKDGSADTW